MIIDESLLKNIREYLLAKTGILYFKNIRTLPQNLQVTCPFHKGGQENKPSANIRTTEGNNTYIGNFHCFTCGMSMSLSEVLKEILGPLYNEVDVNEKFQLNNIEAVSMLKQPTIIPFELPSMTPTIPESQLRKYRQYNRYLEQRNINEETAQIFDIGYDNITREITFPIRDKYKNCLGVGRRSVDRKQYKYPFNFVKPLYGVYELPNLYRNCYVCERSI